LIVFLGVSCAAQNGEESPTNLSMVDGSSEPGGYADAAAAADAGNTNFGDVNENQDSAAFTDDLEQPPSPQDVGQVPDGVGTADTTTAPSSMSFGAFRISNLSIASPTLCMTYWNDEDCVNMQASVNAVLNSSLSGEAEPVDMVGVIQASSMGSCSLSLWFETTTCERSDGQIVLCSLDDAEPEFQEVLISESGVCEPENPGYKQDSSVMQVGPCFGTETGSTKLQLFGTEVELSEAQILGTMVDEDGMMKIQDGTIIGFLSEEDAAAIPLNIATFTGEEQLVTLADLLHEKARAMLDDSLYGWHVVFNFSAEQVPVELP